MTPSCYKVAGRPAVIARAINLAPSYAVQSENHDNIGHLQLEATWVPDNQMNGRDKMAVASAGDIFKYNFVSENVSGSISLNFLPVGPIDNNTLLAQVRAWRRGGDKPLPEPMMTQRNDAYMRHWVASYAASMSSRRGTRVVVPVMTAPGDTPFYHFSQLCRSLTGGYSTRTQAGRFLPNISKRRMKKLKNSVIFLYRKASQFVDQNHRTFLWNTKLRILNQLVGFNFSEYTIGSNAWRD